MTTEALTTPERAPDADSNLLLTSPALGAWCRAQLVNEGLPTEFVEVDHWRRADVTFVQDEIPQLTSDIVRSEFLDSVQRRASSKTWWAPMTRTLGELGAASDLPSRMRLNAKHTLDFLVRDRPTGQNFEIFDMGDDDTDEQSLHAVSETLTLIDQFSGGMSSADYQRPRIVLGNNIRLGKNNGGREVKGIATQDCVFLNMSAITERAAEVDINATQLVSSVLVHEVLGHALERHVMGVVDTYFPQYFHYSTERVPGRMFDSIHAEVKARKHGYEDSQPTHEYGAINAAEDFATSVDALVGKAMGWVDLEKVEESRRTPDSYRRDLVMSALNLAAHRARFYDGTPGFVGSNLRHVLDESGDVQAAVPTRTTRVASTTGHEAAQQELDNILDIFRPGDTFKVYALKPGL